MDTTILVADDDREIAELIEIYLTNEGYRVKKAYDGMECLAVLESDSTIKLIILDIMMPNMDGMEVCRIIRAKSNIPILMLSAKTEDMDKISGFGIGADDYMTKPFHPLELVARVKSQMKRYRCILLPGENENRDEICLHDLVINKKEYTVKKRDKLVSLTPTEFDILYLLASNKGQVFSTDEIFERIRKDKAYEVDNTVMVHIRRLREKIEDDSKKPKMIKTVWGKGYKIEKNEI